MDILHLVEQCYNKLPSELRKEPWKVTEHGRKLLQTEDELNAYIAAYGEMHVVKCKAAFQNFPFDDLKRSSFEIFDWGCGQGIASITLINMLEERKLLSYLKCIYLIEPSIHALRRATSWIQQYHSGIKVIPINKYIPQDINSSMDDVNCSSLFSVNIFSNILDIRTLNLAWLANKTSSLAPINYIACIGPKFIQNTNTRISDFCGYFNPTEYFSNINVYPYGYTTNTYHPFGLETRCFVHKRENIIDLNYQEFAKNENDIFIDDYVINDDNDITDNIITFYKNLYKDCPSYNIFFKPNINCDTVDFVLTSVSKGIILINICENLKEIDKKLLKIENVKKNLFNIYLKQIKIDSIIGPHIYNSIKIALFFPNNNIKEINAKIKELKSKKENDNDKYKYLYILTSETDLKHELEKINATFKYDYYNEIMNLISSKWHSYKDGDLNLKLSEKQKNIVTNTNKRVKIKGVAGCGKTQVVANRAVTQLLRTGERVLILTFNISLIQYIRMRINQVPADFSPNMFEVINYHQFFKTNAKRYLNKNLSIKDFDNPSFFENNKKDIKKYKTIIIDEVQDFKTSWIQLIVKYFLDKDGSISLFGDGEQNIYKRELEADTKMPSLKECGFPGGQWQTMNDRISNRTINENITTLASQFAKEFMGINDAIKTQSNIHFEKYYINYWYLNTMTTANDISNYLRWILLEYKLDTKNVTILCHSIKLLRDIEEIYVNTTGQKTMINFENNSQYKQVQPTDLEQIRRVAKTHFTTNCDEIKFSTIHSFKGWESNTIILLIQSEAQIDKTYEEENTKEQENAHALIYTALTRAKCNLFIMNIDNLTYHNFFNQKVR